MNIKTSLPSPECFVKIFEEAKNKKEEVVCILISSGFSGTYQGAMLAKSMVDYEGIYIIDSKCAAAAENGKQGLTNRLAGTVNCNFNWNGLGASLRGSLLF